jgi:D-beta-D-heptose 7-phosphate kinase/D-beta-D-heptose 1-phosphate adenosyltransferase
MIDEFSDLHVLVIGEAMLDSYLAGVSHRLCPEAPVPVVTVSKRRDVPGGAANTAVNVRSLGARVSFLSVVGDDATADALRQALSNRGVSPEHLFVQFSRRTLSKQRLMASAQMIARIDEGDTDPINSESEGLLLDHLTALYPECDAVIVSDYGYGILTPAVLATLTRLQSLSPRILVGDSKCLASYRSIGLTAAKPNYAEAAQVLGLPAHDARPRAEQVAERGEQLLDVIGARIAAVTLDAEGALILERERPAYRTYCRTDASSRAAGAGDTYVSALALALAAGADTVSAAELAAAAAAVVVGKEGTAACSARELHAYLRTGEKTTVDLHELITRLHEARRRGQRIVFTNGCFDILHRGHVTYLSRAKELGDVLVVGVNSDEGIRRLKGPARPINTLDDRLEVLAALSCVDHLIAFDEPTPHKLVRAIRPDVFVKGGDYSRERLPEAGLVEELGGTVEILPLLVERSTTALIERIRAASGPVSSSRPVAATPELAVPGVS